MSDWEKYKFSEFAEIIKDGFHPSSNGELFYIGLEHIEQQTLRLYSIGKSSEVTSNKFRFKKGDILFGKLRPYFRKVYRPKFSGVCSTDIWVIRARKEFDQSFLFYFLASEEFISLSNQSSNGTRMPRADWNNLKNIQFLLPDFPTQSRIASILSSLDDKIELNRRMNQTLEQMAQALFNHYFVDNIDNLPEGWRIGKLGDYIQTVSKTHSFQKPEIIFLNTSDISEGNVLHSKYSSVEGLPGQAKKSIKQNDILFSEIRPANKRYAFINFDAENYVVSTKLMVLRSKSNIDSIFFYFLLTQEQTLVYLQNIAESRSGTFPQITFDQVKEIEFVIPTEEFLKQFIERTLKPTFELIFNNEKESKSLSTIRDTLLPKLMSGEIDVDKVMDEEQLIENELADCKTA